MTTFLLRRFIPDYQNTADPAVRAKYGRLAGIVGIICNVLLFAGKLLAGAISGSVSVTADAVNNLSDASSSIVTLIGFRLAARPADEEHPYGHARMEYLSGLAVAAMIILIGAELVKSSFQKILHPEAVEFSALTAIVLTVSILLKLWMALFNRKLGRKISSAALTATAADSRNDVIATGAVLLACVVGAWTGLKIDGYVGLLVALFIICSGIGIAKDTIDPLLGAKPDEELVRAIAYLMTSHVNILGFHDLMVHDYGPGRRFASVHAEIDHRIDPLIAHEILDEIERQAKKDLHVDLVIHYDPIVTDDETVDALRRQVAELVRQVEPRMTVHDLRVIRGTTHTNLVFDAVLPLDAAITPAEAGRRIREKVAELDGDYYAVVTVEHSFTE